MLWLLQFVISVHREIKYVKRFVRCFRVRPYESNPSVIVQEGFVAGGLIMRFVDF